VTRLTVKKLPNALRVAVAVAAVLSAAAPPTTASAQRRLGAGSGFAPERAPDRAPDTRIAQRGSLSLAQATAIAQGRFQGRVVRAETVQEGGRTVHVIRILGDDGRVRTVRVDAESGAIG
jgi:uncharacterized membrane protein YkoI